MKLRSILFGLALAALAGLSVSSARAQTYRNVVNTRFNTISDGPMQAIVVDVPGGADAKAVDAAVAARVNAARKARSSGLARQVEYLKRKFRWKGDVSPGIPDIVYVRRQGRLAVASIPPGKTRGGDEITFVIPVNANPPVAGDGSWTQTQKDELTAIVNTMYPALKSVYGSPLWTGTVTIINGDNQGIMTDPNALSGGIYDVSRQQIFFAQYNTLQSRVLNLTQMMAIAFHGPASISFDAWERGMARAATIEAIRSSGISNAATYIQDPTWSALDRYELLNQPALGNDRFFPVSKVNGVANSASFPNMLLPRLIMSGSAWLKVSAESPSFFRNFNQLYLAAYKLDITTKNNVPALKAIAAQAVTGGQVEGIAFPDWYNRQFVLDTSVSPGTKLYALVSPLRPAPADDDFSIAIVLYYYQTVFDAQANSDEANLNGTCFPIYWDFTSQNRLFLAAQYERVEILSGQGSVAPTFFNTIGGDASLNGMMRVAIDLPVNDDNLRLYVAPRSMGKQDAPNNFWGVVVGADTGKVKIQTDIGLSQEFDVKQGAFGGLAHLLPDGDPFTRPQTGTLTFTPVTGTPVTRRVNLAFGGYVPVFYVADPIATVDHTFPAGPAMISFPVRPLKPRAGDAMVDPTTAQPLFTDNNLLMARWQQNLNRTDGDNYQRYPIMDPIEPGKGYWENFPAATPVRVQGQTTASEPLVSQGLQHGWNQIGNPYDTTLPLSALQFQYLAANDQVSDLPTAIGKGWIVAQLVGTTNVAIWDFSPTSGYVPATSLEPWKGYWIRVLVSEGVTITYPNPAGRAVKIKSTRVASLPSVGKGWAIPLTLRSTDGLGGTAWLGQNNMATNGYNAKLDAQRPPEFSRAIPIITFEHTDWGANNGRYYSDIRATGSRDAWEVTLYTPKPHQSYTLNWSDLTSVPRATRLILVDPATGKRQYMQSTSSYTFSSGDGPSRKLQILPEQRGAGVLQIMNMIARTSRGVGAGTVEVAYDLNQSASVTAEIRGIDGRMVRRLSASRAATVGTNTVLWDTKDDRAVSVPAGSYMVNITARTPEGETAHTFRMVTLVR